MLSRVRLWFVLSPIEEGNRQRIEPSVDEESPKFHDEAASFFLMCDVCGLLGVGRVSFRQLSPTGRNWNV